MKMAFNVAINLLLFSFRPRYPSVRQRQPLEFMGSCSNNFLIDAKIDQHDILFLAITTFSCQSEITSEICVKAKVLNTLQDP